MFHVFRTRNEVSSEMTLPGLGGEMRGARRETRSPGAGFQRTLSVCVSRGGGRGRRGPRGAGGTPCGRHRVPLSCTGLHWQPCAVCDKAQAARSVSGRCAVRAVRDVRAERHRPAPPGYGAVVRAEHVTPQVSLPSLTYVRCKELDGTDVLRTSRKRLRSPWVP